VSGWRWGVSLTLAALLAGPFTACDRGPSIGGGEVPPDPALAGVDARYRLMLRQEMVQVEATARRLASHLVRGESELAAGAAAAIRDTLVLERSLTPAQREELRQQLPPGYRQHEEDFRRTAGALSAVAAAGDLEEGARLYGRLLDTCLACHSRYASGRFPGFTEPLGADRGPPRAGSP
jgi:hypothetical protein